MSCDRVRFAGLRRLRLLVEAAACRARARARSVWTMGGSGKTPKSPHRTRSTSTPGGSRRQQVIAERQRMLAELAHMDGSEAGDSAADGLLGAGALRTDAPESTGAATASGAYPDAPATLPNPGFAAAWATWKQLAAHRRSVASKVAAFQARANAPKHPAPRLPMPCRAAVSSAPGGAVDKPVVAAEVHSLDGTHEEFRSTLLGLGLEALFPLLVDAGVNCMADAKSYDSSTQLRNELERSGKEKVPMHLINRLLGKKAAAPSARAAARPAATPSSMIDLDMLLGSTETEVLPAASASEVPRVDALLAGIRANEADLLVLQSLSLAGVSTAGIAAHADAEMYAELLETSLASAGVSPDMLAGPHASARGARLQLSKALAKARLEASAPLKPSSDGPLGGVPTSGPLHLESFSSLLNAMQPESKAVTLEEEASLERLGRLSRNPAACEALEALVGVVKRGDHELTAKATLEAQRCHPALAELLHQESVKLPAGTSVLVTPGGEGLQGGTLRELARQILHVQKAAPKAIAISLVVPSAPARISSAKCIELVRATWFWKLHASDASGTFDLGKLLDAPKSKSLLGGAKATSDALAADWMLSIWPALSLAFKYAHPSDHTAADVLAKVGSLAQGNNASATLVEGLQEVISPFLAELHEAGAAFATGGEYPSCSAVWEKTARACTPVQAWLQSASLRSRQSVQITDLQTENKTLTEALSKLTSRLEKLEKKPPPKPPPQGAHPPKEGEGDAPNASRADKRADRAKEHQASRKAAEQLAAAATSEGAAPSAAPATEKGAAPRVAFAPTKA